MLPVCTNPKRKRETVHSNTESDSVSCEPLENPARSWTTFFVRLMTAAAGVTSVLVLLGGNTALIGGIIGGIVIFNLLIVVLAMAWCAHKIDRRLKAFRKGDFLVHWRYSMEEWHGHLEAEWQRKEKAARAAPYISMGITGLVFLMLGIAAAPIFNNNNQEAAAYVFGGVLGAALGTALGAVGGWCIAGMIRRAARRKYQRLLETTGETYIGRDAAYCTGDYCSWNSFGLTLEKIDWLPGNPQALEVTIRLFNPKAGDTFQSYRLPIPHGKEDEAEMVVRILTGR